ncbi:MAG: O-antigen ligase family protein [candidate division Zixibacteria bacterium]|nr:O-antigen ligase family protein [candidate division Zixibacteria bacterium]
METIANIDFKKIELQTIILAVLYLFVGAAILLANRMTYAVAYFAALPIFLLICFPRYALNLFIISLFFQFPLSSRFPLFPADLAAGALILSALANVLLKRDASLAAPSIIKNYILITLMLALTGIFAIQPDLSLTPIFKSIILLLLFLSIYRVSRYALFSAAGFFFWISVINGFLNLFLFFRSGGAMRSFGFTINTLDDLLMIALPLGISLFLWAKRYSVMYLLGSGFVLGGLLVTQSRTSIAFGLLATLVVMVLSIRKARGEQLSYAGRRAKRIIIYGLLGAVFMMILYPSMLQPITGRFGEISSNQPVVSFELRKSLYHAALVAFQQHPVLGIGPGNFRYIETAFPLLKFDPFFMYVSGLSAHSPILHYLAETGLVGALMLIALYWRNLRQARRSFTFSRIPENHPFAIYLLSMALLLFTSIFLEGGWTWGITSYAATFLIAVSTRLYDDTRRIHL